MAKATFDSVVASRKLSLAFVVLAVLSLCTSLKAEANFTLWVNRRSITDVYSLKSNTTFIVGKQCGTKPNYLVNEKQCAPDEELLSGCGAAVVPIASTVTSLIPTTSINSQNSVLVALDDSFKERVVIIGFNGTNQTVNSSFCHISSLEVYRGREQVNEINHQGFSLSENGSIEIHEDQLAYGTEEYEGELYHMNLSCSGGGLPLSGCLFFKVAGNTSTVADKFNGTVPGTFQHDSGTQQSTDPTGDNITTVGSVSTTVADMVELTIEVSIFAVGSTLYYILIGIGGGIFLSFVVVCICVLVGFSVRRKRKSHHRHAQDSTESDDMELQRSDCQRNPAYGHCGPTESSPVTLLSDSCSENPAYNINAQPSSPQEPTYEVIPSDTSIDTDRTIQGGQNINCSQNPEYLPLGVHVEESFQASTAATSPCDYSQNPAYGIHSNPS